MDNPEPVEMVMAAGTWANNAELIADVARLGYLRYDMDVLDVTYGLGRFWTKWQPFHLVGLDLDPSRSMLGLSHDFRDLPYEDACFDATVIDPPYKGTGTSHGGSDAAYGVKSGMRWQDRNQLIIDGITECVRVTKPHGTLLVKCQDQVVSGKVRWQTDIFTRHAEALGCTKVDSFNLASYRAQPPGRRQVHARRNFSTLLVFEVSK